MLCPTDGATLVITERQGIEIDYCPTCRGVWLDRGELDKIIERSAQAFGAETVEAAPPPAPPAAPPAPPAAPPVPPAAPPALPYGAPPPAYPPQQPYQQPYPPAQPYPPHQGHHAPYRRKSKAHWLGELFDL
jgi:Zn-finger nucleic acid-binding protein